MAPESQRDSFPNHSCSLLPASQLGPISLSKSHLDEAPALLNANSHFNSLSSLLAFFSTAINLYHIPSSWGSYRKKILYGTKDLVENRIRVGKTDLLSLISAPHEQLEKAPKQREVQVIGDGLKTSKSSDYFHDGGRDSKKRRILEVPTQGKGSPGEASSSPYQSSGFRSSPYSFCYLFLGHFKLATAIELQFKQLNTFFRWQMSSSRFQPVGQSLFCPSNPNSRSALTSRSNKLGAIRSVKRVFNHCKFCYVTSSFIELVGRLPEAWSSSCRWISRESLRIGKVLNPSSKTQLHRSSPYQSSSITSILSLSVELNYIDPNAQRLSR
ncbi:hypothetical protein Salat_2983900 [Sesamum alatum]|uniref:Uncharacterized protein n=1 Tax=Sesamum alatum TaxID=300844 RepID=A0AAE2C7X7_9LAMI|nr:hypothetical protein Salat_2983900 [Sesamum alatum]